MAEAADDQARTKDPGRDTSSPPGPVACTPGAEATSLPPPSVGEVMEFRSRLRAYFDLPETWQLLLEKIEKDLRNPRGPGLFACRMLAYAHGEPRQTIEVDIKAAAQRYADETGVPVADILAKVAEMAARAGVN